MTMKGSTKEVTMVKLILVLVFLVANLGFGLWICEAGGPYDPWSWSIFMQQVNPGGLSWGGSPQAGPGYSQYGYNYFNPWGGPSMPQSAWGFNGSLGFYNPRDGMPFGNNGPNYGYWPNQDYYRPGTSTMGPYGSGGWYVPFN